MGPGVASCCEVLRPENAFRAQRLATRVGAPSPALDAAKVHAAKAGYARPSGSTEPQGGKSSSAVGVRRSEGPVMARSEGQNQPSPDATRFQESVRFGGLLGRQDPCDP